MTRAEFLRYARKPHMIPDMTMPYRISGLVSYFWDCRKFAGVVDNPLNMEILTGWEKHTYITLERWERECMFMMDSAMRRAYGEAMRYHMERKQVKVK